MLAKKLIKLLAWVTAFWLYSITFWAWLDHFEIESSTKTAKVWEAIDLTIKAVDKSWAPVKDYTWKILIFSQTDPTAELPWALSENTYTFKASDAWVVKFENAIKFSKEWTQDINVYDMANEDLFGNMEIQVWNSSSLPKASTWTTSSSSGSINIKFPESWSTVWTKDIKVSWITTKNHKVKVTLNTNKTYDTISSADWSFEIALKDVVDWQNSLKADLLDADWKVIGSSSQVLFTIESKTPTFKSIKLDPEENLQTEQTVNVEVSSEPWLMSVQLIINDQVQNLAEATGWTYTWTITLPKEEWNYKIDVVLKNELGVEFKQNAAKEITIKAPELQVAQPQVNCDDFKKELVIKNIKLVALKSKSVLSWDKLDKASSYNVYKKDRVTWEMKLVQNVTDTKFEIAIVWEKVEYDDFAVKAVFKDDVCNVESADYSNMTKVQTWPGEIAIALISLIAWGLYLVRRKRLQNV